MTIVQLRILQNIDIERVIPIHSVLTGRPESHGCLRRYFVVFKETMRNECKIMICTIYACQDVRLKRKCTQKHAETARSPSKTGENRDLLCVGYHLLGVSFGDTLSNDGNNSDGRELKRFHGRIKSAAVQRPHQSHHQRMIFSDQ
jgi:hypothetical protein